MTQITIQGVRFYHNSDYSGNVGIYYNLEDGKQTGVCVPCHVLLQFLAEAIRYKKISRIEQLSSDGILEELGL